MKKAGLKTKANGIAWRISLREGCLLGELGR